MPTGIYPRTEYHKNILKKSHIGCIVHPNSLRNLKPRPKGCLAVKHKKDCSCFRCLGITWNKGTIGMMPVPWNKQKRLTIICKICSKKIVVHEAVVKLGRKKFCSASCRSIDVMRTFPNKETLIEKIFEAGLKQLGISYQKQIPLLGMTIVDFLLPDKVVVYCDGDYWHRKPGIPERDSMINKKLKDNGYKVYRFWEKDIHSDIHKCLNQIQ